MPSLEIPGILRADELVATVDTIAALQLPNGMIPWFAGGHADPWNHVEAAMALLVGGRRPEAERAFDWLMRTQRPDGAWAGFWGGKIFVHIIHQGVIIGIAACSGPAAPAVYAGLLAATGPAAEVSSNVAGWATGMTAMVATGPV